MVKKIVILLLACVLTTAAFVVFFSGEEDSKKLRIDKSGVEPSEQIDRWSVRKREKSFFSDFFDAGKIKRIVAAPFRGIRPEPKTGVEEKQEAFSVVSQGSYEGYVPPPSQGRTNAVVYLWARRFHDPAAYREGPVKCIRACKERFFNKSLFVLALEELENDLADGIFKFAGTVARKQELTAHKRYLSVIMSRIGLSYEVLCQYSTALAYYNRALALSREVGDKFVESVISTNLGILRARMGHGRKALELFRFALSIDRESGDKEGIVSNLVNIAALRHLQGELSGADIALNEARAELSESSVDLQDFQFMIDHNHAISRIYEKSSRWVLSELAKIEKGYDFEKRDQGPHRLASLLVNKGEMLSALERFEEAEAAYERALRIMKKPSRVYSIWPYGGDFALRIVGDKGAKRFPGNFHGFDGELYWRVYRGIAAACIDDGQDLDKAAKYYRIALEATEHLRSNIEDMADRAAYMSDKRWIYNEAIDDLCAIGFETGRRDVLEQAWEIFEMKQGREFLDQVGKSSARNFSRKPTILVENERKYEELRARSVAGIGDEKKMKGWMSATPVAQAEKERVYLRSQLVRNFPEYSDLITPRCVSWEQLRGDLRAEKGAVLAYNVGADHTILWVARPDRFEMLAVDVAEADLERLVERFRYYAADQLLDALNQGVDSGEFSKMLEENFRNYTDTASRLYDILLPKQAVDMLEGANMVYVVPTGPLHGLPFEALVSGLDSTENRPRYLLDDFPVAYLSSASMLKILKDSRKKRKAEITPKKRTLLAFGNPVFPGLEDDSENVEEGGDQARSGSDDSRSRSYLKLMGGEFSPLPETEREVLAISEALRQKDPGGACDLYLGEKALRSEIFALDEAGSLDDYKYVVFATHAVLPGEINSVLQPAIVLSRSSSGSYLTMSDIYGLKMNSDLVVLSACNTGAGKRVPGEGVVGLTRAFMYAGTSTAAVNLWAVESLSAEMVNRHLFQHMAEGNSPARALRLSKLKMLEEAGRNRGLERHPFFWAPMIIFGLSSEETVEADSPWQVVVEGETHFKSGNNRKDYGKRISLLYFRPDLYDLEWNGVEFAAAGAKDSILFSPDGEKWYLEKTGSGDGVYLKRVQWLGDRYLVFGYHGVKGAHMAFTSSNGFQWEPVTDPVWKEGKLARGNGSIVVIDGDTVHAQKGGGDWRHSTTPHEKATDIAFAGPAGQEVFVIVGEGGVRTSPDGLEWRRVVDVPAEDKLAFIHWNGQQFLAVGENIIATSPDASNWKTTPRQGETIKAVAWNGEYYVGVGYGKRIFVSENGIDWTDREVELPYYTFSSKDIGYNGKIFVVVGSNGKIITSADGHAWKKAR